MNADRILALKLVGDVSSINKSMRQTQGRMRSFAMSAGSWVKAAGIGLAIEGVSRLTDALGDAWSGFRDGEKASAQLATTWANLGVKGADLNDTIADISAMTLKLGTDDTEAIKAFNSALTATGGDPLKAMQRLRIAQDLVANGSAPNLQSALKLIDRAASGSAATVRRFGLKSDTAAGRVKELGDKVRGAAKHARDLDPLGAASNAIGEGLETIVGALAKGDLDDAAQGITDISVALSTFGSDIAPGVTTTLDKLTDGGWSKFTDWVGKTFTPVIDDLGDAVTNMGALWDELKPHIDDAILFLQPLIDKIGPSVAGGLGFVIDAVSGIVRTLTDLLKGDFTAALDDVTGTLGNLGKDLDAFFLGIPGKLVDWAVDIAEGAAQIGSGIYNGIVDWVTKLPAELVRIVRDGVNQIIDVWNALDFQIPPFSVPGIDKVVVPDPLGGSGFEVFGGVGPTRIWEGSGDLIPDIPRLAKGGIVLPRPGGTMAQIGEAGQAEAVIPLDRMGDLGGGNVYNINVNVPLGADLREVGRQIVRAIREYERADGKVWRTA